ncbi:MAG: hypothetical protein AAGC44_05355 [Planctomycetota bacterium]
MPDPTPQTTARSSTCPIRIGGQTVGVMSYNPTTPDTLYQARIRMDSAHAPLMLFGHGPTPRDALDDLFREGHKVLGRFVKLDQAAYPPPDVPELAEARHEAEPPDLDMEALPRALQAFSKARGAFHYDGRALITMVYMLDCAMQHTPPGTAQHALWSSAFNLMTVPLLNDPVLAAWVAHMKQSHRHNTPGQP